MIRRARLVLVAAAAAAVACATSPDDASEPRLTILAADPTTYEAMVHPVFEKRCGSLDCHGQLPRGLRVYGALGLRLPNDAGLVPGVGKTTADEALATYGSILAVQPEKTNALLLQVNRTPEDAYELVVLTKPLALERHRGGTALYKGEPAEQCIVGWLIGRPRPDLCAEAVARP